MQIFSIIYISLLSNMVISLIHPHTCGFAKVAAWEATRTVLSEMERDENESPKEHEDRKMKLIFGRFVENFNGNNYNIYFNMFCEKLPALRKKFNSWNSRKIYEREKYLNVFSTENWKQLMHERKPSTALWIEKAASTDMSSSPCFQWHPGNSLAVKRLARCLLLRIFHPLLIHHLL